jgi:hypothetical protein
MAERFLEREEIVDGELPVEEPEPGVAPSLTRGDSVAVGMLTA